MPSSIASSVQRSWSSVMNLSRRMIRSSSAAIFWSCVVIGWTGIVLILVVDIIFSFLISFGHSVLEQREPDYFGERTVFLPDLKSGLGEVHEGFFDSAVVDAIVLYDDEFFLNQTRQHTLNLIDRQRGREVSGPAVGADIFGALWRRAIAHIVLVVGDGVENIGLVECY